MQDRTFRKFIEKFRKSVKLNNNEKYFIVKDEIEDILCLYLMLPIHTKNEKLSLK